MIKKIIYPIIFILSIQIVFAMYGGETVKIFDEPCVNLTINVTVIPYQDKDEFKLSNCELLNYSNTTSNYKCNCSTVYFTPNINSVGNYTFDILYYYQEEETTSSGGSSGNGGSGGRSSRRFYAPLINVTEPEEPIIFCGDGNCTKGEDCSNCARDCGECPVKIIPVLCVEGELRCADGTLLICQDENWEIKEICECVDGECVKKSLLGTILSGLLLAFIIIFIIWWFFIREK